MKSSEVARTTLGTMGKIADRLFIEGSPEQIRERIEQLVRERRIQAARWCKTWREYEIDELTPRSKGRFYMTPDGDLLTPARGQVFAQRQAADGSPTVTVFDEHAATAFAVADTGGIITFEKAPMSATQLDFVERRRADKLAGAQAEQREQAQQVRSWRSKQPTRAVTLADLEQRDMPTVSAAAELLHDLGCKLGARDGTIVVEAPSGSRRANRNTTTCAPASATPCACSSRREALSSRRSSPRRASRSPNDSQTNTSASTAASSRDHTGAAATRAAATGARLQRQAGCVRSAPRGRPVTPAHPREDRACGHTPPVLRPHHRGDSSSRE